MFSEQSHLVDYLRRCYEADNRETGISDLFRSRHRHLHFVSGEEVALTGTVNCVPLPSKIAGDARKEAYKYRRDKMLVYVCLPIVGPTDAGPRLANPLCAPLVFFPSDIEVRSGAFFLCPDWDEMRINFPVLTSLAQSLNVDLASLEEFLLSLDAPPWPRQQVHTLAASLASLMPSIDFMRLASFPRLLDEAQVTELAQTQTSLSCLPACAMTLLPNSPDTRGVLFELAELAVRPVYSRPLLNILRGSSPQAPLRNAPQRSLAPSVLSEAQQQVLTAACSSPLTMVIGPPGTGKSHTIASLAVDHLARGETVLIASRMEQAVNVVGDKLDQLLGTSHAVVRAGRKQHLRNLKSLLENLLQGISAQPTGISVSARDLKHRLLQHNRDLSQLEQNFLKQIRREIHWGSLQSQPAYSVWSRWMRNGWQALRDWQLDGFDAWQCMGSYLDLLDRRSQLCRDYLQSALQLRLERLLKKRRAELNKFLQALRSRSDSKQQRLFREIDFGVLLHAFPVWLCKLTDLSHVLPLKENLFDVVILDEASQCDIASCLPLLQRGKRAVVVGDPKQLRHISFLARSRQESIAEDLGLSSDQQTRLAFRSRSILDCSSDALQNQSSVIFLNEHFRSQPEIIGFSNREFYNGALAMMRQHPRAQTGHAVRLQFVGGCRNPQGSNGAEVDAVLEDVQRLVEQQQTLPENRCSSIGILSPFREQVDRLTSVIGDQLDFEQLRRHDVLIGTAHTFQGEERGQMYLSLALDDSSHPAAFRFLEDPHVLNVSVTRARDQQTVFLSFDPQNLSPHSLLRRYLEDIAGGKRLATKYPSAGSTTVDAFRDQVIRALEPQGDFQFWKDHPVAGITLDLIVAGRATPARCIGIDFVGHPGRLAAAYSLERYRMLARAGLHVYPLSYRSWLRSQSDCSAAIIRTLRS
jgi:hypothetical protein